MLTLLSCTLLAVTFPGGTPSEFASALASEFKPGTMIVQGDAREIKACTAETSDLTELARVVKNQTGLSFLPGQDVVFSDGLLARRLTVSQVMRGGVSSEVAQSVKSDLPTTIGIVKVPLPGTAFKGGLVTFKTTKSESLDIASLANVLSKPLTSHWIYAESVVALDVTDLPELELLKWLSKGIGARLIVGAKNYQLEFYPIEIRRRAINTIQLETPGGATNEDKAFNKLSQKFRINCLNALSPAQLSSALKVQGAEVKIDLDSNSPLTSIAARRVRDVEQYQRNLPADSPAPRRAVGVLSRLDRSRAPKLIVDSQFNFSVEVPIVDAEGKPSGVVRI